jgi:hypothetical protein
MDALGAEMLAAPLILVAGLIYNEKAAEEARRVLAVADEEMLNRAAECGLHDEEIARVATELVSLGIGGAQALGDDVVDSADLECAEAFFRTWTLARRSPADER